MTQQPHSRSTLASLFWSETSEEKARNSLRVTLTELKKPLAPYLTITRHTLAFNSEISYWLDTQILQRKLASDVVEDVQRLNATIALYRGDFLEGISYEDAPEFEGWVMSHRNHFKKVVVQAHDQLAKHYLQQEAYTLGIQTIEQLLVLEPWNEEAHRQLMLLLSCDGQRSAALRQYETCKQTLKNELNVLPTAETTNLYHRIKVAEKSTRYNLPQSATSFVGRTQELATLSKKLEHPDCRFLTLVGPGGIGKTRLALEVAALKRHRFLEGVYFVPLEGVDTYDFIPQSIMDALEIAFSDVENTQAHLIKYLKNREVLFVIDNFEHLMPGTSILKNILDKTTKVKFLVTSTEHLNLRGEWVIRVEGLDFPVEGQDTGSAKHSAVQLFLNEASRLGNAFTEKELPYINQICHRLEGMPLGIELAAGMTQVLPYQTIAEKLEEGIDFLATSKRDVPERHQSLTTVFEHAWQTLSVEEKESFMKLSVFRSGFSLRAAERVANLNLTILEGLLKKSILQRRASGRYHIHNFLRQFSEKKALERMDIAALKNSHLDFFLERVEQALSVQTQIEPQWFSCLKTEMSNLQAALSWALDHQNPEKGLRLIKILWRFFDRIGHWEIGVRYLNKALAICPDDDPQTKAALLNGLANLSWKQGNHDQSQVFSKQSFTLFKRLKLSKGIAESLQNLARVAHYQGHYKEANVFYHDALTQLNKLEDRQGVSMVLRDLGRLAYYQGNYDQALTHLERSLAISRQLKDERGIAYNLSFSSEVVFSQGDLHRAKRMVEKSLIYSEKTGDIRAMTIGFNLLGAFHCHQKTYEHAENALEQSLALSKESGDLRAQALSFNLFGFLRYGQKNNVEAENFFQKSLGIRIDLQDHRGIAESFEGLALAVAKHEPKTAAVLLGASNAIIKTISATLDVYDYGIGLSIAPLKKKLSKSPYDLDWAKGASMSLNEAFSYALDGV